MTNNRIEDACQTEFGLLNPTDKATLIMCLDFIANKFDEPLNITELGVNEGKTTIGMKKTLESWGVTINRFNQLDVTFDILNRAHEDYKQLVPEVNQIKGDSLETYDSIPDNQHLIFIDGCHCLTHCICDFVNLFPKVKQGGLILMHDANPDITDESRGMTYQGHGDSANLDSGVSSRIALNKLCVLGLDKSFKLFLDRYDPNDWIAGIVCFEKL